MMTRLGDVCDILNGFAFKSEQYVDDGIRIIRIANVQKGYIEDSTPVFYPFDSKDAKKYSLEEGDMLMSLTGNVGRVAKLSKEFLPAALNQRVACLRIKDGVALDKAFLFNLLNSDYFEQQCIAASKGVAQKNMSTEWLKEYEFPMFSLEQQKAIASVLDKVTELIALRKEQLAKLDQLVKSRFVELFGDLMLNLYEWPVVKISDVSLLLKSGLSRKLSDDDIGLPVIRSGNIQNGQFIYDDVKYWYKDDPQGSKTEDYILEDGDILVNFINSASQIGKTAIFRDVGRDCIYTTNIFRMKLSENCNEYYYNWFAMSDYYYRQLQNIIQPAVNQASFTTVNFLKLNIPLPPMELQEQFAAFVEQTDKSKLAIQQSLDKLELLKKALMQDYFG